RNNVMVMANECNEVLYEYTCEHEGIDKRCALLNVVISFREANQCAKPLQVSRPECFFAGASTLAEHMQFEYTQ
ncbi:hypothetical protein PanWU01x14_189170, partial [Parasponia andersonii]